MGRYQAGGVLAIAAFLFLVSVAEAHTRTFSGSCEISGPITPEPGITVVPRSGARFTFHGTGRCSGRLDGRPRQTMRARLDFVDVEVLFDTCQLGPDFDLEGVLAIKRDGRRRVRFPVTVDLGRVAIVGTFALRSEGGLAIGTAQFAPSDPDRAPFQCAGEGGGITSARLTASLRTLSALTAKSTRGPGR